MFVFSFNIINLLKMFVLNHVSCFFRGQRSGPAMGCGLSQMTEELRERETEKHKEKAH